jgi:hypothetical protein
MDELRRRVVEIEWPDGYVMLAEVGVPAGGDVSAQQLRCRLEDAGESIQRIGRWLVESVHERLPRQPERVGLEFGIRLAVKSGKLTSVLAEASGEATVLVRLEWDGKRLSEASQERLGGGGG